MVRNLYFPDIKMKKHSRTIKVLVSLIVSMTFGAFVLMMLDDQALSEGAFSLAGLYNLAPVADKIAASPKTTNHRDWDSVEVYYSKKSLPNLDSLAENSKAQMHFVITNGDCGTDGLIKSTEKWRKQRTCLSEAKKGLNVIRVCIAGGGSGESLTDCQVLRTVELVDAISKKYNITRKKIAYPANWQI